MAGWLLILKLNFRCRLWLALTACIQILSEQFSWLKAQIERRPSDASTSASECAGPADPAWPVEPVTRAARVAHDPDAWLRAFKDAGDGTQCPNMAAIRALRQEIWMQTKHVIGNIDLSASTHVVTLPRDDLWQVAKGQRCKVQVLQNDILEEAMKLSRSFSVAVLNMASPRSPGGGVANGAGAQEETMFRRTNLASFLRSSFYPLREECLASHGVSILRGTEQRGYPFLGDEKCEVTFLSCAAPAGHQAWGRMFLLILWPTKCSKVLFGDMLFFRFLTQNRAKSKDRSWRLNWSMYRRMSSACEPKSGHCCMAQWWQNAKPVSCQPLVVAPSATHLKRLRGSSRKKCARWA